jgi:hypothetical protein
MYREWLAYWQAVKDIAAGHDLVVLLNGELGDQNKHSPDDLISQNKNTQLRIAIALLQPMLDLNPQAIHVVRGTPAHSGNQSWMDERIAHDIGAVKHGELHSTDWLMTKIDGVRIEALHKPPVGPSKRPWLRNNYALTVAKIRLDEYLTRKIKPPQLAFFGHYHYPGDSYETYETRAIITPGWKLPDSYVKQSLSGSFPYPVGGSIVTLDRGEVVNVKHIKSEWKIAW